MTDTLPKRRIPARTALIAAALLGVGIAGGATVAHMSAPSVTMAPAAPVAIRALSDDGGIVTVRGKVAELYGPMFVLTDGSGRALIEGGRQVDATGLVAVGQVVSVQGRFRHGMLHAAFLVAADGKVTALRPMGPPPGGPGGREHGPHGRGPGGPDGPDGVDGVDGADRAPPPPAASAVPATVPAPAPAAGNSAG